MKEVISKLGYKTQNGSNAKTVWKRLDKYNIDTSHFESVKPRQVTKNDVFCVNSTVSQNTLRRWFIEISDKNVCSICGQNNIWNNQELVMILDHINGDNHDNRIENLRWVCPNCGTQLPTFAGKNNKSRDGYEPVRIRKKYTKICPICNINEIGLKSKMCIDCRLAERRKNIPSKEILEKLIYEKSFVSIGNIYGVSDNAVRKWCASYNLPFRYGELVNMIKV